MLTRLFVDNYKCFENFEFQPAAFNLILGANGSGKSTLFEVIHALVRHIGGRGALEALFPQEDVTRDRSSDVRQRFELGLRIGDESYDYSLVLAHDRRGHARILEEIVHVDGKPLLVFKGEEVLIRDADSIEFRYPFAGGQSPLAALPAMASRRLARFAEEIRGLWVIRPVPQKMSAVTRNEAYAWLESDLSNFTGWFTDLLLEKPKVVSRIVKSLRPVLDGFTGFTVSRETARTRTLRLLFRTRHRASDEPPTFAFDEISDGQRMLVALYTLLHHVVRQGKTLCIDEPDNFVALPEIQPWLDELRDTAEETGAQILMISHHPRVANLLASKHGVWFERHGARATATTRVAIRPGDDGIPVAELLSRGWLGE
ncbi:MAG TPA: AAA family ATPase [Myxococcales bacterium]|jgi:ABC-type lipoprotein export system ATPase subunit|nr:AAA family ATPase [Myxococcales bacterium]